MNNITVIETPRSDKKGPEINKIGIKIIIQAGIILEKNN